MALTTTAGGGPILRPEDVHSLVVQPLLDEAIAARVSTVVQTSSTELRVPYLSEDAQAAWTAELAEIAVDEPALSELTVTPKKLAGLTVVSNELANDSSPTALSVVGQSLTRDLRRKVDQAYFSSAAPVANAPAGIGTLTTATVGAGGSFDDLDWAAAAISNAETLSTTVTSFVTSPATALALSTMKEFGTAGSNVPLLSSSPTEPTSRVISGVPLYVTPAVEPDVIWSIPAAHSLFVLRQGATVTADSSVYFTKDGLAIRAVLRVAFGWTLPLAITKVTKV